MPQEVTGLAETFVTLKLKSGRFSNSCGVSIGINMPEDKPLLVHLEECVNP